MTDGSLLKSRPSRARGLKLTQWRVGMSGPTGLDYAAVYPLLDRKATDSDEWEQLFDDLRVMESAALEAIAESREHD